MLIGLERCSMTELAMKVTQPFRKPWKIVVSFPKYCKLERLRQCKLQILVSLRVLKTERQRFYPSRYLLGLHMKK